MKNNPTVVGGALPRGSVSLVIYNLAAAGGSAKHANHGRVVGFSGFEAPTFKYNWVVATD